MEIPTSARPLERFGTFEVDLSEGELRHKGIKVKLQEQPFRILAALLEQPGALVTREQLRERLWQSDTFVDFEHSLNAAVKKLRSALRDDAENPRFIETVPKRGYKFIAPIAPSSSGPQMSLIEMPLEGAHSATEVRRRANLRTVAIAVTIVVIVIGLASATWQWRETRAIAARPISSLAVLPLDNLSGERQQDYFADGMTDEVITELGKLGALRVISRTSAMQYKGARKPLGQIARELNVDAVVEGSVLRSGDHVRITAQLIRVVPEKHLWAESYEGDLSAVLTLQREIAQAIANAIQVKLRPGEQERVAGAHPVNPQAHEAYLLGRYFWNRRTGDGLNKAIDYFQQAIEKDSNYAPAYAGLADAYGLLGFAEYGTLSPKEAVAKAEAAANRALQIDETLAEAHTALGAIKHRFKWDWEGADREFKRAINLNPNYATAHHWYALYLASMGRMDEAVAVAKRGRELDPLSLIVNTGFGRVLYFARQNDQAIERLQKTLDLDPNFPVARYWLGLAYEQKGMYQEAVADLTELKDLSVSPLRIAGLGHAYAVSGDRAKAQAVLSELKELSRERYVSPYDIAVVYAGLGDKDQTFRWLEKTYQEREGALVYISVEPMFDTIRSDPRFKDLVHRVGLPPISN
jgi:TolB-like protein/DNA-binding winged helix-turn-helix (wHTH) protein/Flp pilus assembly protein TadD